MKTTKALKKLTIAEFAAAVKDAPYISDEGYDEYINNFIKKHPGVKIPTNKELEKAFGYMSREWNIGLQLNVIINYTDMCFFEDIACKKASEGTDFESPETFRSLGYQSKDGHWISGSCKF